jgi:flagellar motor switch protein FliM
MPIAAPKTPQDDEPVTARTFPTKEDIAMTEPAKEGAAALLKDVPLQIAVELGRVPVTAEDVVNIHVGQVLELNKAPGEPVDLSVHGKVVARGELVEVEGQVGVRILSLTS